MLPPRRDRQALMAKPAVRIAAIQFGFALGVLAILARAAQLQIVQGERWAREAERKRTERVVLPARRGALYDRNGVPLAITQEFYHVGVAPNELEDRGRRVPAAGAQPRRVRARARPRVPGAQALDLSPRAIQRDAGAAAPPGAGHPPHRQLPAVLSVARARPPDHRRTLGRPAGRGGRPGAVARLHPHRAARARRCSSRTGPAGGTTRPRGRCASRCRATTWCSRSTPSCRRSPSAGSTTRWRRRGRRAATSSSSIHCAASCWRSPRGRRDGRHAAGVDLHRSVRARLDRQALHRGGAAHARG